MRSNCPEKRTPSNRAVAPFCNFPHNRVERLWLEAVNTAFRNYIVYFIHILFNMNISLLKFFLKKKVFFLLFFKSKILNFGHFINTALLLTRSGDTFNCLSSCPRTCLVPLVGGWRRLISGFNTVIHQPPSETHVPVWCSVAAVRLSNTENDKKKLKKPFVN